MANKAATLHPQAICESTMVGVGTRVWAFAHILPGARIGSDGNICDGVFIENDVTIGDRVTIKCGVQVWDGITIEDDVFVGPNVTFTNDPRPRSRQRPPEYPRTIVRRGASIGGGAVILPGIEIGADATVGAGAVVTRDVAPGTVVVGNPARLLADKGRANSDGIRSLARVGRNKPCRLVDLEQHSDARGTVSVIESERFTEFPIRRIYYIHGVPEGAERGGHAHAHLEQLFIAVSGSFTIKIDDGESRGSVRLDDPGIGLYVGQMVWREMVDFSPDGVCLVIASQHYDPEDYFRDYQTFLAAVRIGGSPL